MKGIQMKKIFNQLFLKIFLAVSLATTSGASIFLYTQNTQLREDASKFYEMQKRAETLNIEKLQLNTDLQNLRSLNYGLNVNLNKTNTDLTELTELNFNLTDTIKDLELENTELVESIVSMTKEIEELNKKVKALSVTPIYGGGGGGSYSAPSAPVISSNAQDPALLAEITQLKADLATANEQKALLNTQLIQLNTLVGSLQADITSLEETITGLNNSIITLSEEKEELENELNLLTNEDDVTNLINSKNQEIALLQDLISEKTDEINLLNSEKEELIEDSLSLTLAYNNLVEQRDYYKNLNDNLNVSLANLNTEIDGYKATIIELNNDVENYKAQVADLNETISSYQLEILSNQELIDDLNGLISDHLDTIATLEGNNQSLATQMQYYIDTTGPAVDFDTLNTVSQLAVKANVRIEVGSSTGSGVVYKRVTVGNSYEFYILTNYHVIQQHIANNSTITVKSYAGISKTATLLASQFHTTETSTNRVDLAVVKVVTGSANEYYVLDLAPSTYAYAGQLSFSIGTPRFQWNTVTVGNIIGSDYSVFVGGKIFTNSIKHNALIDSGNSGGALIDANLNIIGINFAGAPQTNTFPFQSVSGYALPINKVHIFLEENNLK
jgi:S1-C subfamily serine protease